MSSLIIEVCRVDKVDPHPNADRLCICTVKGWRVCAGRSPETGRNEFEPGDKCVYIPPDAVLPPALSDRLNVTKYLSPLARNADGVRPPGGRVRVARLRGEPSYGLIMRPDDPAWAVGADVAAHYGITKWEPPPDTPDGEAERSHPAFHAYVDIENFRNFPDLFQAGEEVVFTEKIHGKNVRVGLIRTTGPDGAAEWTFMAGGRNQRRKEFDARGRRSQVWTCLTEPVRALLRHVATTPHPYPPPQGGRESILAPSPLAGEGRGGGDAAAENNVVLFGELYGAGVQDMWYGFENGGVGFRAFDLAVSGKYVDSDVKAALFARFRIEIVPILYRGPFSRARVEEHVSGPTTLCPPDQAGRFKGREGIVIVPVRERPAATESHVFDRLILKAVSFEYLERKGGTEYH